MAVDPFSSFLGSLGLSLLSSGIYDGVKKVLSKSNPTRDDLRLELVSLLHVQNAEIIADKIIDFLAKNGNILIQGTHIRAGNSISMFSSRNTELSFGDGSISETKNTKIVAGKGARIVSKGGAGIRQNDDGSISFYA